MSKRARQYIGLCLAILSYYIIHEGAHLMYALKLDVFKKVNFIGLGVQIDVFAEKMTENHKYLYHPMEFDLYSLASSLSEAPRL